MTVVELQSRIAELEQRVAELQQQLEQERVMAGVRRGLEAADAGKMAPAREVLEQLRQKHRIAGV
jgi:predicted transcriptional regulator